MPFKDNGRAILIGSTTAGSTGQPYNKSFGYGMGVAIGTKREYFPDGSQFEGVGIEPDIRVVPTPKICNLARILNWKKQLTFSKPNNSAEWYNACLS